MRFPRRKASVLLTCILVVGSLIAPFSHLVYMAASDMYTPVHGVNHMSANGDCYADPHHGHAACPYLLLFAVPLIGDLAQPITSPAYDPVAEPLLRFSLIQWQPTFAGFHLSRGPPHNS